MYLYISFVYLFYICFVPSSYFAFFIFLNWLSTMIHLNYKIFCVRYFWIKLKLLSTYPLPFSFPVSFLSCVAFEREGWLKSLSSVHHSFANHLLLFLETSDAPNMKTEVLIKWGIIGKDHPQQTPSCPVVIIIIIIAPEKFMLFNFLFSCLLYLG